MFMKILRIKNELKIFSLYINIIVNKEIKNGI